MFNTRKLSLSPEFPSAYSSLARDINARDAGRSKKFSRPSPQVQLIPGTWRFLPSRPSCASRVRSAALLSRPVSFVLHSYCLPFGVLQAFRLSCIRALLQKRFISASLNVIHSAHSFHFLGVLQVLCLFSGPSFGNGVFVLRADSVNLVNQVQIYIYTNTLTLTNTYEQMHAHICLNT